MRRPPGLHLLGPMHRMPLDNQLHLPVRLLQQARQEAQKHFDIERALEDLEAQMDQIRDRRNHITAKALAGAGYDRGLPAQPVAASDLVIRAQAHLVTPVDHRLLGFGAPLDRRIFLPNQRCTAAAFCS